VCSRMPGRIAQVLARVRVGRREYPAVQSVLLLYLYGVAVPVMKQMDFEGSIGRLCSSLAGLFRSDCLHLSLHHAAAISTFEEDNAIEQRSPSVLPASQGVRLRKGLPLLLLLPCGGCDKKKKGTRCYSTEAEAADAAVGCGAVGGGGRSDVARTLLATAFNRHGKGTTTAPAEQSPE
jgi:hypothetical protein